MSFSSSVKEELNNNVNFKHKELLKAELLGYLITSNATKKNLRVGRLALWVGVAVYRFSRFHLSSVLSGNILTLSGKSPSVAFLSISRSIVSLSTFPSTLRLTMRSTHSSRVIVMGSFPLGMEAFMSPHFT